MNKNELQVLIDYTKGMIADNKEPEKKVIIALCDELESLIKTNEDNNKLIEAFCADDVDWNKLIDKKNMESSRLIELIMKLADELCNSKRKQMKLGVIYARNHLIS
ncbi:hypothetical protein WCD96_19205, partial [Proteus mirabilis]